MSAQKYIKSTVKGADLYRRQGLYAEARDKYKEVLCFLSEHGEIPEQERIREVVEKRIRTVEQSLDSVSEPDQPPALSEGVQDLIKNLFSFSQSKEAAEAEGAIALMSFGQHRRALWEFERLLGKGIQPLLSAKNILFCLLAISTPDSAISRFRQWAARSSFSIKELSYLKNFLQSELREKGINFDLPLFTKNPAETSPSEEIVDPEITSLGVRFEEGPLKGQRIELSVTFQFGNVLSVIISSSMKAAINTMKPGAKFYDIEFYSPIAFFRGSARIRSRTLIKHGPRQGDYLFDIAIEEN